MKYKVGDVVVLNDCTFNNLVTTITGLYINGYDYTVRLSAKDNDSDRETTAYPAREDELRLATKLEKVLK